MKSIIENWIIASLIFLLILMTILTNYFGSTDLGDYRDVAKFFSDNLSSKIRSSHSYLYGFMISPFLTKNLLSFKIASLLFLFLIVYSIYYITDYNKKSLFLILLSPIIWYMAPWISPIQLSSLLLLWSWFFINKYDKNEDIRYLFYSGTLLGLSLCFWDTILFFGAILFLVFMFNKKLNYSIYFLIFFLIGLLPRMLFDQYYFNFPVYSILKNFFSNYTNLYGGIYNLKSGHTEKTFVNIFSVFLATPIAFWFIFSKNFFKKNKKTILFLVFALLLIFMNPQIRYVLALAPIIIIILSNELSERSLKLHYIISIFILILFIFPYVLQIKYSINEKSADVDFNYLINNPHIILSKDFPEDQISKDLNSVIQAYPNEVFLVGNGPDDYQLLSSLYWGDQVDEFVSIQDYNAILTNNTILFKKEFSPMPNFEDRRQIWLVGGLKKSDKDSTDYNSINYAIGINEPVKENHFELIKKYNRLYLSKRI